MNHRSVKVFALVTASLGVTSVAGAAPTDVQACLKARLKAAAKYAACQNKANINVELSSDIAALKVASSKCRTKYAAVFPKLQEKYAGTFTACDQNRFVDNLDGTVTDNLTGLQWEKKTDDSATHDKDNVYYVSWSGDGNNANYDGNVFDVFLGCLNGFCMANCLGGQCDWRVPSREELQTILIDPYPCTTSPCLSATFGLAIAGFHLTTSSPTVVEPTGEGMWAVSFATDELTLASKTATYPVRAVRGGL